jgi:hypothetical protein
MYKEESVALVTVISLMLNYCVVIPYELFIFFPFFLKKDSIRFKRLTNYPNNYLSLEHNLDHVNKKEVGLLQKYKFIQTYNILLTLHNQGPKFYGFFLKKSFLH